MNNRFLAIVAVTFAGVLAIALAMTRMMPQLDKWALLAGNIIMALLTLFAFLRVTKAVNDRPQAFVRGVYSATLLKLMVCMVGIIIYVVVNKATLYKPTVFVLLGIYAVYTIVETLTLSRSARC